MLTMFLIIIAVYVVAFILSSNDTDETPQDSAPREYRNGAKRSAEVKSMEYEDEVNNEEIKKREELKERIELTEKILRQYPDKPWEERETDETCFPSQARVDRYKSLNTLKMGNYVDTSGRSIINYHRTIMMFDNTECRLAYVSDYDDFEQGACIEKEIGVSFDIRDIKDIPMLHDGDITFMLIETSRRGTERNFNFMFGGGDYGELVAQAARDMIWKLKKLHDAICYN